jgi:hypothetical protein
MWTVNLAVLIYDFSLTLFMNVLSRIFQCNGRTSSSEPGWDPDHAASGVTFSSEDDYEIATCIRTSIIPASVRWYTGEAAQDDFCQDLQDLSEEDGVFALVSPVCCPSACAGTVTAVPETEIVAEMKPSEHGEPHKGSSRGERGEQAECKQS